MPIRMPMPSALFSPLKNGGAENRTTKHELPAPVGALPLLPR